jgi:hypothetical protein
MNKKIELPWKQLTNDRVIMSHKDGFSIIKPQNHSTLIPLACPVCHFLMRDHNDALSYIESLACSECKLIWYDANREKWKEGWRPAEELVQKERKKRLSVPSYRAI